MATSEDIEAIAFLISRRWWIFLVRGVAALVFGVIALAWPDVTVYALVVVYGAYALVDGVLAVAVAIGRSSRHESWVPLLFEGALGITAGIVAFAWPDVTALVLLYLIASWAIITGIVEIAVAIRLRKAIENEWLIAGTGVASVLFGLALAALPGVGLLAVTWLVGVYAVMFGAMLIAFALRLRRLYRGSTSRPRR